MKTVTLNAEGMSRGHCKAAVEGELNGLAGVQRSNADVDQGAVEVLYDEGRVTMEDLEAAVVEAGYAVASWVAS